MRSSLQFSVRIGLLLIISQAPANQSCAVYLEGGWARRTSRANACNKHVDNLNIFPVNQGVDTVSSKLELETKRGKINKFSLNLCTASTGLEWTGQRVDDHFWWPVWAAAAACSRCGHSTPRPSEMEVIQCRLLIGQLICEYINQIAQLAIISIGAQDGPFIRSRLVSEQ